MFSIHRENSDSFFTTTVKSTSKDVFLYSSRCLCCIMDEIHLVRHKIRSKSGVKTKQISSAWFGEE